MGQGGYERGKRFENPEHALLNTKVFARVLHPRCCHIRPFPQCKFAYYQAIMVTAWLSLVKRRVIDDEITCVILVLGNTSLFPW